jgi:hypothetical protein
VASQINSYIFSESPLFIYGVSGHSSGANSSQNKKTDKIFFTEDSIPFHKKVPYCVSIPFLVAESIYQCIDAKLIDEKFSPDPQILSEKAIIGALTLGKERYFEAVEAIKKYANSCGLDVSDLIERNPYKEISKSPFPDQIVWQDKILEKNALGMRMDSVGVRNIYQFTQCLPVADANQGSVIILFQELLGMYQEISELKNKDLKNINELNLLNQTLSWMESSISWKITQPLRDALSVVKSR